jgi:hypothetical protein
MKFLQIGLLGLGTVGQGTYQVIARNQEQIQRRLGRGVHISMVADLDTAKAQAFVQSDCQVVSDANLIINNPDIEVVASPKQLAGLSEFYAADPGAESGTFNQDEWQQWKRNGAVNANNLGTITGNRACNTKELFDVTPAQFAAWGDDVVDNTLTPAC